jgi:hypothetical protein
MEPRPWPEDGATEIEKALLRAGRAEGPRKGMDLRILAMIQGASPPTVKPVALARWVKVGLIAVVAGGAAVVAHQLSRPAVLEAAAPVAAPAEARAPEKAPVPPVVSESLEAARKEEPPPVPGEGGRAGGRRALLGADHRGKAWKLSQGFQVSDSPLDQDGNPRWVPKPSREASLPAKPAGSALDHSLRDETRALDRAREALDAHRPAEVLRLLDEYSRSFPQGRLRPEAVILRLAALLAAGRQQAADSLASQLLSDEAYVSYVPRIQSLLREVKP